MNDYAFVGRWETARELAYLVHMDYGRCLDKIQMIRAFRVVFPYLRTVWENDAVEAYLDGHHAGSRHAWTIVGTGGASRLGTRRCRSREERRSFDGG